MNEQLERFARDTLKNGLTQCTDGEVLRFKRMYSHKGFGKSTDAVVDDIPTDRLDWAMQQVQRTLDNRTKWPGASHD